MASDDLQRETPFCLPAIDFEAKPNDPITLYAGSVTLNQEDCENWVGPGEVRLVWLPRPSIKFTIFDSEEGFYHLDCGKTRIALGGFLPDSDGSVDRIMDTVQGTVHGDALGEFQPTASIEFAIPNFGEYLGRSIRSKSGHTWGGRLAVDVPRFRLLIDQQFHLFDLEKQIRDCAGYGITHQARVILPEGNAEFTKEDAGELIGAMRWFLSFCRGRWTGPLLPTGRDKNGEIVWTSWKVPKISPWHVSYHWTDGVEGESLEKCLPGFLRLQESETWRETIRLAVHWYVEANMCAGGIEGAIVLTQAALETLAWHLLVEEKKLCSEGGFRQLPAEDKIRLLLADCRIPFPIPPGMFELSVACRAQNWIDGPMAITQIRNALVHGQPNRLRAGLKRDSGGRYDAWNLGLWYLELVLLSICEYSGRYYSRVNGGSFACNNVVNVPWV